MNSVTDYEFGDSILIQALLRLISILSPISTLSPISDTDQHVADLQTVIDTAPLYRLSEKEAHEITDNTFETIAGWRNRARRLGLSNHDCTEAEHLFLTKSTD